MILKIFHVNELFQLTILVTDKGILGPSKGCGTKTFGFSAFLDMFVTLYEFI